MHAAVAVLFLQLNFHTLPAVEPVRNLGVLFSTDMSPSVHVNNVDSKAHARANMILWSFVSRDIHLLIRTFINLSQAFSWI